jgi:predicted nucleotidyltransferase component of viral defense system
VNTATQLKALIRNLSKDKKVNAQILLRNYILERFLERISLSKHKYNFILKGGMLVAAMVGIDARSTMDMDATIKNYAVTDETIKIMFEEILRADINDNVEMTLKSIEVIRDEADYAGFRVSLSTIFDGIKQILKIDITTGDFITPREVGYSFNLMFEDRAIEIMAYNLETVLSEKLETIISRGTTNTRMRDFYDIYILTKLQAKNINKSLFAEALNGTAKNRGTDILLNSKDLIVSEISSSDIMKGLWVRYQKKYDYAEDVSWNDVISAVRALLDISELIP